MLTSKKSKITIIYIACLKLIEMITISNSNDFQLYSWAFFYDINGLKTYLNNLKYDLSPFIYKPLGLFNFHFQLEF